jgi:hypothetical protein
MIETEKVDATLRSQANPPRCHCGVSTLLTTPSQPGALTPFYRCGLLDYVSSHESNLSLSLYAFCTFNVTSQRHYLFDPRDPTYVYSSPHVSLIPKKFVASHCMVMVFIQM